MRFSDVSMYSCKDRVVTFPLSIVSPQSQSSSLDVKTMSVTQSRGIQADSGFIVDREVSEHSPDHFNFINMYVIGNGFLC